MEHRVNLLDHGLTNAIANNIIAHEVAQHPNNAACFLRGEVTMMPRPDEAHLNAPAIVPCPKILFLLLLILILLLILLLTLLLRSFSFALRFPNTSYDPESGVFHPHSRHHD